MRLLTIVAGSVAAILFGGCREPLAVANTSFESVVVTGALATNITRGRVDRYDAGVDYFPDKITIRYARGLRIDYHRHYKVVTADPGGNGTRVERFALVQRGTPSPSGWDPRSVIEVPVHRFAMLGQTYESLFDDLDLENRLVGVYQLAASTAPSIRTLIDEGSIVGVGAHQFTNVEALAAVQPEVVGRTFTDPDRAEPLLRGIGVRTIPFGSVVEPTVLARAEWMKLIAVLFNREKDVSALFDRIAAEYQALSARARAMDPKPVALFGYPDRDRWVAPAAASELIEDAGGVPFTDAAARAGIDGTARVPIESVIARASNAPLWVALPEYVGSLDALVVAERRLAMFRSVRTQEVYDLCGGCPTPTQNTYWTESLSRPHDVLRDLVSILHPQLVPGHRLIYYRRAPRSPQGGRSPS
jgi:iron complex transport system substrate-binding protein